MTNNGVDNLSQSTANVIYNTSLSGNAADVKKEINAELQRMLEDGKISEEEYKAAAKFIKKEGSIMDALAARNRLGSTLAQQRYLNDNSLHDKKADKLMEESGLTIGNLNDAVQKFAGKDYKVSDKIRHLSKEKDEASELENIQNYLNDIIKENGGNKELTKKETKLLMKALGVDVGRMGKSPLLNLLPANYRAVINQDVGEGKKASESEQNAKAGGENSVTNKTEAAMYKLAQKAGIELDTEI